MKVDPTSNIPTQSSRPEEWIEWHKGLKSNFGKKVANSLFTKAWVLRGTPQSNTGDLREYLSKNGIVISTSAWDKIVDKGSDVTDFFGDVFNIGKYAGIGLAVILVGGIGMLVFNIAKDPNKAVGSAANLMGAKFKGLK